MPIAHTITDGIVIITGWDSFSQMDVVAVFKAASKDPQNIPPKNMLIDITRSKVARTQNEVVELSDLFGELRRKIGIKAAVLVADPLHFGIGRMVSSMVERHGILVDVFYDRKEALKYLTTET